MYGTGVTTGSDTEDGPSLCPEPSRTPQTTPSTQTQRQPDTTLHIPHGSSAGGLPVALKALWGTAQPCVHKVLAHGRHQLDRHCADVAEGREEVAVGQLIQGSHAGEGLCSDQEHLGAGNSSKHTRRKTDSQTLAGPSSYPNTCRL